MRIVVLLFAVLLGWATPMALQAQTPSACLPADADGGEAATPEATALPEADAVCLTLPDVSGNNLSGQTLTFPDDLAGEVNLIVMPFDQDQQERAGDWLPLFQALAEDHEGVEFYSLAALPALAFPIRALVEVGLDLGVRDRAVRDRLVLLYLAEQDDFIAALDIPDTETMQVFVVDAAGRLLWRGAGGYDDDLADELRAALNGWLDQITGDGADDHTSSSDDSDG